MAGTLAEIVLRAVEKQKLSMFQEDIVLYVRYIDDILIVWNDSRRVDKFSKEFTLMQYSLKLIKEYVFMCIFWICRCI